MAQGGAAGRCQIYGLQGQDCGTLRLVRRGQCLSMNQRSCVRARGGTCSAVFVTGKPVVPTADITGTGRV